ncbi:MAG: hypothetical protein WBD22_00135 [Pyrinomonadaceae bacterium]
MEAVEISSKRASGADRQIAENQQSVSEPLRAGMLSGKLSDLSIDKK